MESNVSGQRKRSSSTELNIDNQSNLQPLENHAKGHDNFKSNEQKRQKITKNCEINKNSIMVLKKMSFIHNNKITKEQEVKYNQIIQKWIEEIRKVKYCKELLNVVTQCENLKIIFDFESELVSKLEPAGHSRYL